MTLRARRVIPVADPDVARREGRPGYYVIATGSDCAVNGPYDSWEQAVRTAAAVNREREKRNIRGAPVEVHVIGLAGSTS